MAIVYKIHPAIGAARVGNSAEYYLAPEKPGGLPLDSNTGQPIYTGPPGVVPPNIYHDASGALKKQGARFKVFAYDNSNPADPGTRVQAGTTKVNGKTVTAIEWTVYLANKKASWFEFEQLTGSGMEGDLGYNQNNANNPGKNPKLPFNALRSNVSLGISSDPNTINDSKRRQLILDPGPRTVYGPKAPAQEFAIASKGLQPFNVTTLGRILTDADCNLIVLAGNGCSGSTDLPPTIDRYANNSGWFDDVSDGPVTGVLVLEDDSKVPIDTPSWVLCGPPKYAPEITNLVTLYDTMYDVFVQHFGLNPGLFNNGFQASYKPNQASEIVPLLSRPNLYHYVAATGSFGASQHAALPAETSQQFAGNLQMIRPAGQTNARPNAMPLLAGDNPSISDFQVSNFLTLTATQFFVLNQYAHGIFSQSAAPTPGEGVALDRANLENCVGGAFCPGIEMTWISRNTTIYLPLPANPAMSDAFRIKHKNLSGGLTLTNGADNDYSAGLEPGDIIKYMAQPWQADFNECSAQPIPDGEAPPPPPPPSYWWWPAQRPFSVFPRDQSAQQVFWTRTSQNPTWYEFGDDLQMVTNWKDMGFILNIGSAGSQNFVEIERNDKAIDGYGEPLIA
jgi:L-Lysine epsilon oxidase N-terminal/L-lysine epsilon oxidase C-terminal domain